MHQLQMLWNPTNSGFTCQSHLIFNAIYIVRFPSRDRVFDTFCGNPAAIVSDNFSLSQDHFQGVVGLRRAWWLSMLS